MTTRDDEARRERREEERREARAFLDAVARRAFGPRRDVVAEMRAALAAEEEPTS